MRLRWSSSPAFRQSRDHACLLSSLFGLILCSYFCLQAKALLPKAKPGESYQARIAPNHLNVFLNLANLIAKNETRLEEADMLYRQAISMRADYTQAYINRGDVLLKLNKTKEAQQVYERALFYDSTNPDIYYNVSVFFSLLSFFPSFFFYFPYSLSLRCRTLTRLSSFLSQRCSLSISRVYSLRLSREKRIR